MCSIALVSKDCTADTLVLNPPVTPIRPQPLLRCRAGKPHQTVDIFWFWSVLNCGAHSLLLSLWGRLTLLPVVHQDVSQSTERQSASPAVTISDVTKHYQLGGRVTALDGVSLSLPEGSYTAVMGPSGSGKSTLLNLIGGLDTPDSGQVSVGGTQLDGTDDATRADVRGTEIGFVFQTFDLLPRLTAVQNVALPLTFADWGRADRRDRAATLLDDVGLGDRLDHRPPELSGGQRQRVAIARALAADPSIVLADEPTGNVDTETGGEVLSLLGELHEAGNTVLLVTHARRVAERAQQIVHVRDGSIEGVERLEDDAPALSVADGPAGGEKENVIANQKVDPAATNRGED